MKTPTTLRRHGRFVIDSGNLTALICPDLDLEGVSIRKIEPLCTTRLDDAPEYAIELRILKDGPFAIWHTKRVIIDGLKLAKLAIPASVAHDFEGAVITEAICDGRRLEIEVVLDLPPA